jgi:deoxyadenosine/deoxycytidine kinase/NTP pyrophosphatase (non-canonical NTP hydrolase)
LTQQVAPRTWYVAIEGAIGVGKTTLARRLREHLDTEVLLEVFEENPFLSKFYESRARYAFQTQMFFLLSRYRQQQQVADLCRNRPLIADYIFAKDWLFAQLNLAGDEWDIYQQLHTALAEQIVRPDLLVYLQANTDVLMARIAQRDRPYERDMDRGYIDALRLAYERFFAVYDTAPILYIDTNDLNFVTRQDDFQHVVGKIRAALKNGTYQQELPQMKAGTGREVIEKGARLGDYQSFHRNLDRTKGFITDLYFNYLCLSEEIGELGSALADLWRKEVKNQVSGKEKKEARQKAIDAEKDRLEEELADCMAYLLKMANYAGIDLEAAYLSKMRQNLVREWNE